MATKGLGLEITELRLGIPGGVVVIEKSEKKRVFSKFSGGDRKSSSSSVDDDDEIRSKSEVVGWPPVCSYRKRNINNGSREGAKIKYMKVSMDGAPFLRKIDLSTHKDYTHLLHSIHKLFCCFGICEALEDANSSEYVPIYEDKDGDWILLGDVPWEMFTETCKRLRIMKRSDRC